MVLLSKSGLIEVVHNDNTNGWNVPIAAFWWGYQNDCKGQIAVKELSDQIEFYWLNSSGRV
jgi:hypothetical protein